MKSIATIIPDVHGRTFWRDAVGKEGPKVFLGDYLDPYDDEGEIIPRDKVFSNFLEILDFAHSDSGVRLLLGNHDLEYMIGRDVCDCRCDYLRYGEIREVFLENADLFGLCWETEAAGVRQFLSHAGIHPWWFDAHRELFGVGEYEKVFDAELLNRLFRDGYLDHVLADISRYRTRFGFRYGSVVWSDIREYAEEGVELPKGIRQIVGHTRCLKDIDLGGIVCIDSEPHSCHTLWEDGSITSFQGTEEKQ